jgi:hypothetical protein
LNFQQQNPLKNQHFPHLSSANCEINSIKLDWGLKDLVALLRAFQQHQSHPQIPIQFSILILFRFHWENGSMFNSFHTVAPNSLKPSQCTLLIKTFPRIPRAGHEVQWFERSQCDKQNKTNYLAS